MQSIPAGARLFLAALLVYGVCPPFTSYDSYYVVPTVLSLVRHGSTAVDEFMPDAPVASLYAAEWIGGHWRNFYPVAVPVLVTPLVAALRALVALFPPIPVANPAIRAFFAGDFEGGSVVVELACAAFLAALTAWIVWAMLARLAPPRAATAIAVVFAFGTTQLSIASRNLMQHGLSALLLSIALYLAVLSLQRPRALCWAAVPVALAFTVRPANWIAVVVFTAYVAIHHSRQLPRFLACAAPVAAAFFAYNLMVLGRILPRYFAAAPAPYPLMEGLVMNLFSPGHGLFVYMPVFLFACAGMVLAWRQRWLFPLSPYLAAIVVAHYLFIAPFWPGHCFGPRYFAEMTPVFSLFLVPIAQYWQKLPLNGTRRALGGMFLAMAFWGLFVNLRGATSTAVQEWSAVPVSVDDAKWRVWEWNDPPFSRGLR